MNQSILKICLLICVFCLPAMAADNKLRVVATTPDFGAIAREIGSNMVEVTVLAKPVEDVHFVSPKPSYITKLARADVLIEGGAELEIGWLPPLLDGARNPKLTYGQPCHVACSEGLALLEVPSVADRAQGDIHGKGNPHFMTDPLNAVHTAKLICDAFIQADGKNADAYRNQLNSFTNRLNEKMVLWQKQLEPFKGRRIVAYHNSWPYFAARFGLKMDIFLEPKPGIPPTPAHLSKVISTVKVEKIGVIVVEPYQNRKTAKVVADKTGAVIADFTQYPGGVACSGDGYIELLDYLVNTLAEALKKN